MHVDKESKIAWLGRYKWALQRALDLEYQLYYDDMLKATILSDAPRTTTNTSLDTALIRREALEIEYIDACEKLLEIRSEIIEAIDKIKDGTAARVLYLRYIVLMDWVDIADTIHYTQRSIRRYHRQGLQALQV